LGGKPHAWGRRGSPELEMGRPICAGTGPPSKYLPTSEAGLRARARTSLVRQAPAPRSQDAVRRLEALDVLDVPKVVGRRPLAARLRRDSVGEERRCHVLREPPPALWAAACLVLPRLALGVGKGIPAGGADEDGLGLCGRAWLGGEGLVRKGCRLAAELGYPVPDVPVLVGRLGDEPEGLEPHKSAGGRRQGDPAGRGHLRDSEPDLRGGGQGLECGPGGSAGAPEFGDCRLEAGRLKRSVGADRDCHGGGYSLRRNPFSERRPSSGALSGPSAPRGVSGLRGPG